MYGLLVPQGGGDPIPLRKEEIVVGRKDDCDVVLRFSNVSGKHCKLVLSNGYWYVLDMNSTNGVKVNGAKVTDHRVDPGAALTISKHVFKIQYDPMENGAVGQSPADVLREGDILSRSLMERLGLQHAPKKNEEPDSTVLEMPVVTPQPQTPKTPPAKKDFFSQLKFD